MLGFIIGAVVAIIELIINPYAFMGLTLIEQIFMVFGSITVFGIFGFIVEVIINFIKNIKIKFRKK